MSNKGKVSIKRNGTAVITVKVSGNSVYTDVEKRINITVSSCSIAKATIGKIANQCFTGKTIKPPINASYNGNTLKLSKDFRVSYINNKKAGTASITVTGINGFNGSRTFTFIITSLGRVSLTAKNSKGNTKLSWNQVKNASGYKCIGQRLKTGNTTK